MAKEKIYQLYAELQSYEPTIWRRFQISNQVSLLELAQGVMRLFRMEGTQQYSFWVSAETGRERYVAREDELDWNEGSLMADYLLGDVAPSKGKRFVFEYDEKDGWCVALKVEELLSPDTLDWKEGEIRLLDGAGYGIIEGCGGTRELERIRTLCRERKGEEYQAYAEHFSEEMDLDCFDKQGLQALLTQAEERADQAEAWGEFKEAVPALSDEEDELYDEWEEEEEIFLPSSSQLAVSDALIEGAMRYYRAELYKKVEQNTTVPVRLGDKTVYAVLRPRFADRADILLHLDIESLGLWVRLNGERMSRLESRDALYQMNCVGAGFQKRAELEALEAEVLSGYAERKKIRLSSLSYFPYFTRREPEKESWFLMNPAEAEILSQVFEGVLALSALAQEKTVAELGFVECGTLQTISPCLVKKDGGWTVESCPVELCVPNIPVADLPDETILKSVSTKQSGKTSWDVAWLLLPKQEETPMGCAPSCSYGLVVMDHKTGQDVYLNDSEVSATELLKEFAVWILTQRRKPHSVHVADQRTKTLLETFCHETGIAFIWEQEIAVLGE